MKRIYCIKFRKYAHAIMRVRTFRYTKQSLLRELIPTALPGRSSRQRRRATPGSIAAVRSSRRCAQRICCEEPYAIKFQTALRAVNDSSCNHANVAGTTPRYRICKPPPHLCAEANRDRSKDEGFQGEKKTAPNGFLLPLARLSPLSSCNERGCLRGMSASYRINLPIGN